ncbi:MAG: CDP-diacylglycerol--glycerol-3-phosphate 3-phosphatidyltransferase [Pseudomonadota bacterium]
MTPLDRESSPNSRSIWNIPNALTALRILSIPFLIYLLYETPTTGDRFLAAVLFGVAFWTDFFDGMLARRMKKITRLGKVMDPMADKLMVITALILLTHLNAVNVLVVILLVGREVVVNALRALASAEGIAIAPSFSGRAKVFAEGFGVAILLAGPEYHWLGLPWTALGKILIYLAVGLALWSAVVYFRNYSRETPSESSAS